MYVQQHYIHMYAGSSLQQIFEGQPMYVRRVYSTYYRRRVIIMHFLFTAGPVPVRQLRGISQGLGKAPANRATLRGQQLAHHYSGHPVVQATTKIVSVFMFSCVAQRFERLARLKFGCSTARRK